MLFYGFIELLIVEGFRRKQIISKYYVVNVRTELMVNLKQRLQLKLKGGG